MKKTGVMTRKLGVDSCTLLCDADAFLFFAFVPKLSTAVVSAGLCSSAAQTLRTGHGLVL